MAGTLDGPRIAEAVLAELSSKSTEDVCLEAHDSGLLSRYNEIAQKLNLQSTIPISAFYNLLPAVKDDWGKLSNFLNDYKDVDYQASSIFITTTIPSFLCHADYLRLGDIESKADGDFDIKAHYCINGKCSITELWFSSHGKCVPCDCVLDDGGECYHCTVAGVASKYFTQLVVLSPSQGPVIVPINLSDGKNVDIEILYGFCKRNNFGEFRGHIEELFIKNIALGGYIKDGKNNALSLLGLVSEVFGGGSRSVNLIVNQPVQKANEHFKNPIIRQYLAKGYGALLDPPFSVNGAVKEKLVVEGELHKRLQNFKLPPPEQFIVTMPVWRQCAYAVFRQKNLLLKGCSGSGKTELACWLGKQSGRDTQVFSFGAMTEPRLSLIGKVNFSPDKGTWFSLSRFVKAFTTPNTVVVLDELSRAPRDAFNLILTLLDRQRYLALDESNDEAVAKVAENVSFIATANIGFEYTGTSGMDRALMDRFVQLTIHFPSRQDEIRLLKNRTSISLDEATYLVDIANQQRERAAKEQEFVEYISTRMLLEAAEQISFGIGIKEAIMYCIEEMFSGEGGSDSPKAKINQIVRRVIPDRKYK